jgi:hypothetical protein
MYGAARLSPATYIDVKRDKHANVQAGFVVLLTAIAGAISSLGGGHTVRSLVGGFGGIAIGWIAFASVASFFVSRDVRSATRPIDRVQTLRVFCFAQTPYVICVLGLVPGFGFFVCWIVAAGWTMWTTSVAMCGAYPIERQRSGWMAALAVFAEIIVTSLSGVIVGASLYGLQLT